MKYANKRMAIAVEKSVDKRLAVSFDSVALLR
jgi:hypothetical protein